MSRSQSGLYITLWAGVGTVAGLFGRWHWFPDLAAYFRPQCSLLLTPFARAKDADIIFMQDVGQ